MKKALVLILLMTSALVYGQETFTVETEHYTVESHISSGNAEQMGAQLESFYSIFNDVFRFSDLDDSLNIEILPNLSTYQSFTRTLTGKAYDSYVYIHHGRASERELLIYDGAEEDLIFALAYQASIQFLMNHVENPPLWIREGFSVYFSKSSGPELERKFAALKNSEERISASRLVQMDSTEVARNFSAFRTEAWAFVTFLMNTDNKEYTRFLYDTISSLKNPEQPPVEVTNDIQEGFNEYLENFLTAQELLNLGISHYNGEKTTLAEQTFSKLTLISPDSWQPLYFLGLLAYDEADYSAADLWYEKASDKGAPEALISYVMGLSAWKDERIEEAKGLLSKAARLDKENYEEKTKNILEYLQGNYPDREPVTIP